MNTSTTPHRRCSAILRAVSNRLSLPRLAALAALASGLSAVQAHNLDTRATAIYFDQVQLALMGQRAGLNQQLVQVNDKFWVIMKTTPGPGTTTGVGGYQTFYVPPGVKVHGVARVLPVPTSTDPRGFIVVSADAQSSIAIGDGPIGAKTTADLKSLTLPGVNGLGLNFPPMDATTGKHRGTIAGVYADTGIFYSEDPRTVFYSYQTPPAGSQPTLVNNSGDTVGEYDSAKATDPANILGVTTLWDAYQEIGYGYKSGPVIDYPDQRGNAPWGLANAVAGPQSGYAWEFDYAAYIAAGGTYPPTSPRNLAAVQAAIKIGPWNRIQYAGSQISKDQPGLISTTLGYAGVDASNMGYALNGGTPLERLADGTGVNAIRFAIGQIQLGQPEYSAVQIEIVQPVAVNCYRIYGDAFGGDAGGTDNGKDHIWRYFDPSVVFIEPCVALSKIGSKAIVAVGETFSYQIVFANNGSVALPNITLTDTLPSGLQYVSATPAPNTVSGSVLTWNYPSVAANQLISITVNVKATGSGTLCNSIKATQGSTTVAAAEDCTEVGSEPLLLKSKSVTPTTAAPGSDVTYTITVSNVGSGPNGSPWDVVDYLPTGFTYKNFVSATINGGSLTLANSGTAAQPKFTIPSGINAGQKLIIVFTATVGINVAPGDYCNGVELIYDGVRDGPIPEACVTVGGGRIGDTVYRDWDGNGSQGAGEEGIAGISVQLYKDLDGDGIYDSGETLLTTTTTDANGNYLFNGLAVGNYVVVIPTPPSGYNNTGNPPGGVGNPPNQGAASIVGINGENLTVDFGYQFAPTSANSASIGDFVYADSSNNGNDEAGEPGIPGVTVWLYEDTNGNGIIEAGDLLIKTTATFPAVIGGKLDMNGDGVIDVNDTGTFLGYPIIAGQVDVNNSGTITAADALANLGGYRVIEGLFDIDGNGTAGEADVDDLAVGSYLFSELDPARSYIVKVDNTDPDLTTYFSPNSFSLSTPGTHAVPSSSLAAGQAYTEADFGFFGLTPGTIGDQVFLDVNGDGVFNAGDEPLAQVWVELYRDVNGDGVADPGELFKSMQTDATGIYTFSNLGPARYVVKVRDSNNPAIPTGALGEVDKYAINLAAGQNVTTADFPYISLLDKSVDKSYAGANETVTYTLKPFHPGPKTLVNAKVTDAVPAGTTYNDSATPTPASQPDVGLTGNVVWNLGSTVAATDGTGRTPGYTPTAITRITTDEVDDTFLDKNKPTDHYGDADGMITRPANSSNIKSALMKFTLPSFAGTDAIDRAVIRVMVKGARASNHTVTMRRMITAWTEGTTASNGATWDDPNGTGTTGVWSGGSFSAADYDSTVSYGSFSAPFVVGQTLEFDVTDLVRGWRAGSPANQGVALIASGTDAGDLQFYSSEENTAKKVGPRLIIAYSQTGSSTQTVRDNFQSVAYNNNNGSRLWAGGWIEVGDEGDPATDSIKITSNTLRIRDDVAASIYRSANLAGATAATLTFDLTGNSLNAAADVIKLQGSINHGAAWTDLQTFTLGTATGAKSYDLVSLLGQVSEDTRIRFVRISSNGGAQSIQVDNLQISYTTPGGGTTTTKLSVDTALLSGTRNVTVTMTVQASVAATVTPPANLTVTGTASASKVSGPTPSSGTADATGITFTYVYQVNSGLGIGSVRFSGQPADAGGLTFQPANSQSVLTTADLKFAVKVNDPAPNPGPIINTGTVTDDGGLNASDTATTATTASIGDLVWKDTVPDGVRDLNGADNILGNADDEVGIHNVLVKVFADADMDGVPDSSTPVGTAVTDDAGFYRVYGLAPGNYLVQYDGTTAPTGYYPTTPVNVTVYGLTGGEYRDNADFGLRPPTTTGDNEGNIGDQVWLDANNDGIYQVGTESGIPGVKLNLIADTNNNGVADPGEPIVSSTTTLGDGTYQFTGISPGNYIVDVDSATLPVGVGLVPIGGNTDPRDVLPLTSGETDNTVDFAYNYIGQIGDTVFYDDDGNGSQNGGEPGAGGVVVNLWNDNDNSGTVSLGDTVRSSTTTCAAVGPGCPNVGYYLFSNLPPGNYVVQAEEQTVESRSTPGLFGTMEPTISEEMAVTLSGGSMSNLNADFGFIERATLGGHVFHDVDHDGLFDTGDLPLQPVTVWLYGPGVDGIIGTPDDLADLRQTTATSPTGDYQFLVTPGDYRVIYDTSDPQAQAGVLTDVTTPLEYTVNATAGSDQFNLDFGRDNPGKIGDTIFADTTAGGGQTLGEPGLAGVTVRLYLDADGNGTGDTLLATKVTDADGKYQFVGLPDTTGAQKYLVQVDTATLPGTYQTSPTSFPGGAVGSTYSTTLTMGANIDIVDFGYPPTAQTYVVSGNVWEDNGASGGTANDGTKNGGEPGIGSVTLKVTVAYDPDGAGPLPAQTTVYSVATQPNGDYSVSGIPGTAGGATSSVTIEVVTPTLPNPAYVQTGDPDGTKDNKTTFVMPAANVTGKNFGYNQSFGSIAGNVADGNGNGIYEAGVDLPLAGVTVTLRYAGTDGFLNTGDDTVVTTTTDALGYYVFDATTIVGGALDNGLLPGTYQITETNPPGYISLADRDGGNPDNITVVLTVGQNVTGRDFEDTRANGSIGDYVWYDENADGVQDAGEPGIANVKVELFSDPDGNPATFDGVVIATTFTDTDGGYRFPGLIAGNYQVRIPSISQGGTLPSTLYVHQTFDPDGTADAKTFIALTSGQEVDTADFGFIEEPPTNVNNNQNNGAIGDRVWIDANGNGAQDPGEAGLAGVPVALIGPGPDGLFGTGDDATLATTTTDGSGFYSFTAKAAGAYVVKITTPPAGYAQTGDPDHFGSAVGVNDNQTTTPILLAPGDVFLNADFGYQPTGASGTVAGTLWFDADADQQGPAGAQGGGDTAEPYYVGVTVALIRDTNGNGVWDAGEPIIATDVTDASGSYSFAGLPLSDNGDSNPLDADYIVWVNDTGSVLAGTRPTYDLNGVGTPNIAPVTLTAGFPNGDADFGYTTALQTASTGLIGDTVFLDADGSNTFSAGDQPLEGVSVQLYDGTGTTLLAKTTTDENGHYYFGGLLNGNYVVKVVPASLPNAGVGLVNSVDPGSQGDNAGTMVTISGSTIDLTQDFGYKASTPNTIGGTIWNDKNANGTLNGGEAGISGGVTVALYEDVNNNGVLDAGDRLVGTKTTDSNGDYSFGGLPNGKYLVDVTDTANVLNGLWHSVGDQNVATDGSSKNDPYAVSVTGGQTITTVDFGYYGTPAALGDFVWLDNGAGGGVAANGIQDGTEVGIPGVEVTLTITWPGGAGTSTIKTVTDANGKYSFGNLLLDEDFDGVGSPEPTYAITVATPAGAAASPSNVGDDTKDSDGSGVAPAVLKGVTDTSYDFGFYGLYNISGKVLNDTTNPGIIDVPGVANPSDTPLTGVEVKLYRDNNNDGVVDGNDTLLDTKFTNGTGDYQFDNLPDGNYLVVEIDPANKTSVTDADGDTNGKSLIDVTISGANVPGRHFLDKDPAPTAADLAYFRATKASDTSASLTWGTLVEFNMLGFKVYRSVTEGVWQPVRTGIIPATGGGAPQQTYRLTDTAAPATGAVQYRLVAIDNRGQERILGEATLTTGAKMQIKQTDGLLGIDVAGQPNARLKLETATDAARGPWTHVDSLQLDGAGAGTLQVPVDATQSMRFYRLIEE